MRGVKQCSAHDLGHDPARVEALKHSFFWRLDLTHNRPFID
jgi:hypothetical protein